MGCQRRASDRPCLAPSVDGWSPTSNSNEAIYFAAYRTQLTQPAGLLRWDGHTWTALGTPPGFRDVLGVPMLLDGQDIYVEAFPDTSTGGPYWNKALTKWNGSRWFILAITSNIGGSGLNSLASVQGNIFGSGQLYDSGNFQQGLNLGRLLPPNWVPIGGGVGQELSVLDIASDGTNLLIQGGFRTVDKRRGGATHTHNFTSFLSLGLAVKQETGRG